MTSEEKHSECIHNDTRTNIAWGLQSEGAIICRLRDPSFLPALKALVKSWGLEEHLRSYKTNSSHLISTSCVLSTLHISPRLKLITLKVILFSISKMRKWRRRKVKWYKFSSWNFAFNCKTSVPRSSAPWTGSTSCDTQHMVLYYFQLSCFPWYVMSSTSARICRSCSHAQHEAAVPGTELVPNAWTNEWMNEWSIEWTREGLLLLGGYVWRASVKKDQSRFLPLFFEHSSWLLKSGASSCNPSNFYCP